MDEGGPKVIDPQISEFRAFDARYGASERRFIFHRIQYNLIPVQYNIIYYNII